MPRGRRRKRDRRGRLYDPEKKRDAGHRAHENFIQTCLRHLRWKLSRLFK